LRSSLKESPEDKGIWTGSKVADWIAKKTGEKKSGRKEDGTTSRNAVILLKSLDCNPKYRQLPTIIGSLTQIGYKLDNLNTIIR
jgi:hypothetical protein